MNISVTKSGVLLARVSLALAAITALYVGINLLFAPDAFYQGYQVTLPAGANIRSDLRGVGALIMAAGGLLLFGSVSSKHRYPALIVGVVLYGAFVAGRAVSVFLDGAPTEPLLMAFAAELFILGLLSTSLITHHKATYRAHTVAVPQ